MSDDEQKPETMHSTDRAYRVEIRATGRPVIVNDEVTIGNQWAPLPVTRSLSRGTATDQPQDVLTRTHNYYGALALACSFMSALDRLHQVEVRLIEYEREMSHKLTEAEILPLPSALDELFARAGAAKL